MLRSLLSGVLRSRAGTGSSYGSGGYGSGGYGGGYGRRRGTTDPGSAIGAQVGRSLFAALRRR